MCKKKHNALKMEGAGRGVGEPNEIFNAFVGPKGDTTQYMTPVHRQGTLERLFMQYTDNKLAHLPQQLLDWEERANLQLDDAAQTIKVLMETMEQGFGLADEEVRTTMPGLFAPHTTMSVSHAAQIIAAMAWHRHCEC